ncbi:MAG: hypothetical protein ABI451_12425, partial [Dokdonella sp.]
HLGCADKYTQIKHVASEMRPTPLNQSIRSTIANRRPSETVHCTSRGTLENMILDSLSVR